MGEEEAGEGERKGGTRRNRGQPLHCQAKLSPQRAKETGKGDEEGRQVVFRGGSGFVEVKGD